MTEMVAKYWRTVEESTGKPYNSEIGRIYSALSEAERKEVSDEHKKRQTEFREKVKPVFEENELIKPFTPDVDFGDRYAIMCRMRTIIGPSIQDMYYASWQSPQNSGEDPTYEELLIIHRRADYGQYPGESVEFVGIGRPKTKVKGLFMKKSVDEMKIRDRMDVESE